MNIKIRIRTINIFVKQKKNDIQLIGKNRLFEIKLGQIVGDIWESFGRLFIGCFSN